MEAMILAGGRGSRLASRIKNIPTPMAPVAGRPYLEILLEHLAGCGYTRAILAVGERHELIEKHCGSSFAGLRIDYVVEQDPRGTGGAIRAAMELGTRPSMLVLNGDTYLDADYGAMMRAHAGAGAAVTMAVVEQSAVAGADAVRIEAGRVVGFEKTPGPGWINAGAYVIVRELAWRPGLAESFSFERAVLVPELARLRPLAFPVSGLYLDLDLPEDYEHAQTALGKS